MAKLETDSLPELGLDFDPMGGNDDISGFISQESKSKSRTPVGKVIKGMIGGVKDTAKNPSFIKGILRKSLPDTYGDIADGIETISTSGAELYDEAAEELKPKLGSIVENLSRLVPENQKGINKILDVLKRKFGVDEQNMSQMATAAEAQQNAVNSLMAEVFAQQEQYSQKQEARDIIRDKASAKRDVVFSNALGSIAKSTSILAQYMTNVTQAYQKRSLELQMRSFMVQTEQLHLTRRYFEAFRVQNEAIIKNTSLPEYAKLKTSERFKEALRTRAVTGIQDKLFGDKSPLKRAMDSVKESGMNFVRGMSMNLDMTNFGLDQIAGAKESLAQMNEMLVSMGEEPISREEMLGSMVSAQLMEKLKDKVSAKLKKHFDKNTKLKENLAKGATKLNNFGATVKDFRNSDKWQSNINETEGMKNIFFNFLDSVMANMGDQYPNRRIANGTSLKNLDEPMPAITRKFHLSVTDIIPGYLSAIQRELRVLRTGNDSIQPLLYDYNRGEFVDGKRFAKRMKGLLGKEVRRSGMGSAIDTAVRNFTGGEALTGDTELNLKLFFSRLSRVPDLDYSPENIKALPFYKDLDKKTKELVDRRLDIMFIGSEKEQNKHKLTKDVLGIRKTMPSLTDQFDSHVGAGYGSILEKEGFLVKDPESGEYIVDENRYRAFLEKEGIIKSDVNVKRNIKALKPKELLKALQEKMTGGQSGLGKKWNPQAAYEGIKKSKLFSWMYKDGKGDDQIHTGPMAQSVHQNLGEDAAPGGTSIDLQSMNGAMMASIDHLGDRIDKLDKKINNKSGRPKTAHADKEPSTGLMAILKAMKADLAAIRANGAIVASGTIGGMGGGLGGSGSSYTDILSNLFHQTTALGGKAIGDFTDAAKSAGNFGKNKIIDPLVGYLKKAYKDYKDPVKEKLSRLFSGALDLGGQALATAKNFMTETLPKGIGSAKDMLKSAWTKVKTWINEARDLYLPNGTKPIIQAVKLRMGFYRDAETGEPIKTMDELLSCKHDIVDNLGNVVLSLEDKASGLYDRYGKQVKSTLAEVGTAILGAASYANEKIKGAFNSMRAGGSRLLDKAKGFFSGTGKSIGFGSGAETHQVIVDIRDILLGKKKDVIKRLKLDATKLMGGIPSGEPKPKVSGGDSSVIEEEDGSSETPSRSSTNLMGMAGRLKNYATKGYEKARDYASQGMDAIRSRIPTKDNFVGPPSSGSPDGGFVGPMPQTRMGKLKAGFGRLSGGLRSGLSKGVGFLGGFFGGGSDQETNSAANGSEDPRQLQEKYSDPEAGKKKGRKKTIIAQKDRQAGDSDGDGIKDGSVEDRKKKQDEAKERNSNSMAKADLTARYKSSENVIDMMARKFGQAMDMIKSKTSSVMEVAADAADIGEAAMDAKDAAGKVGKKAGKKGLLRRLAGGIGKYGLKALGIAGTAYGAYSAYDNVKKGNYGEAAIDTAVSGAGLVATYGSVSGAIAGLAGAGSAALSVGGTVLGLLGSAATAIAGIVASPVVLAGAALVAAGYGGWKLYKYVTRNNADEFQTIRIKQYGMLYGPCNESYNEYPMTLENYLLDGRVGFERGKAYILDKKVNVQDMLDIFKIDKDDVDGAKEWADWYTRRFKPFFLTHVTALYGADQKAKLNEVKSLDPKVQLKYLQAISFESGPYDLIASPFKQIPGLNYERQPILDAIKALIKTTQDKVNEKAKKDKDPKDIKDKGKDKEKEATEAAKAATAYSKALSQNEIDKVKQDIANRNARANAGVVVAGNISGDGDNRAQMQAGVNPDNTSGSSGTPGSLPMAGGGILDGSNAMQFIKLRPGVDIKSLHPGVLKHFLGMVEEYGNLTGKSIQVNDGFRTQAEQAALYAKSPGKAAKPGSSMHEFGLALDINSADADEMEKLGLMKKYGFTRPVGGESWHVEPAGIQANLGLAKNSNADRDKMVEASLLKGGGGYGSIQGSTQGRRNNEMAMALLDITPKPPTPVENAQKKIDVLAKAPDMPAANDSSAAPKAGAMSPSGTGSGSGLMKTSYSQKDNMVSRAPVTTAMVTQGAEGGEAKTTAGSSTGAQPATGTGKDAIMSTIEQNAAKVGVNPDVLKAFGIMESDLNPNARASSGASGLFGIMPKTWNYQASKVSSEFGVNPSAGPTDPNAASLVAASYLKDNTRTISRVKPNPNATDLYLTHFLGPSGATKFLLTNPNEIAANVVPDAADGNKNIFYANGRALTVGEVYNKLGDKIQQKASRHGIKVDTGSMQTTGGQSTSAPTPSSAPVAPSQTPTKVSGGSMPKPVTSAIEAFQAKNNSSGFMSGSKPQTPPPGTSAAPATINISTEKLEAAMNKSVGILEEIRDGITNLPDSLTKAMLTAGKENASNQSNSQGVTKPRMMKPTVDLDRKAV